MKLKKLKKMVAPPITGTILPSKWNEQGKAARISIHTDDKKEYQIDFSGTGKELLNLTYKKVEVRGKLREQLNGRVLLIIQHYKIIEDAPENNLSNIPVV